jgi:hypothetical protein
MDLSLPSVPKTPLPTAPDTEIQKRVQGLKQSIQSPDGKMQLALKKMQLERTRANDLAGVVIQGAHMIENASAPVMGHRCVHRW